jgi:hypothetical protein
MNEVRYDKEVMLTSEEMMKLIELSHQLGLSESETVGLLIESVKIIDPEKKF